MLLSLRIENIALMDMLEIRFQKGLHVLTGETGAGKSIIVDAVVLLLGGKAQKELIRTGAQKARVEGVFDISDCPAAGAFLREQELDEGDEVTLAREITLAGRSSCRVNGTLLPVDQYRQLTNLLMDIHGQHEHQSLMDEKKHLAFLDATGDEAHRQLQEKVKEAYTQWVEKKKLLVQLRKQSADAQERMELLQIRVQELRDAQLTPGEEDELARERDIFKNGEKIEASLQDAFEYVYDGASAAVESLRRAVAALGSIENLDEQYASLRARLDGLYYETEDAGITLRKMISALDFDPDRLEEIRERLDVIRRLSRKYAGASTGDMVENLQEMEAELSGFETLDDRLLQTEKEEKQAAEKYAAAAALLTQSRKKLAQAFEKEMETQLKDLNMGGTRFQVNLDSSNATASGAETARFLIAPNRGEEMQPLSRIASGGELSRLMLAIKSVAAKREGIPSMIFDEIDTGISGKAAQVVGEKMKHISRGRQVLCVTHLQQIAALADCHFLVEKAFDGQRTSTRLTILDGERRVSEIARMLGGDEESAKQHAREMLKQ
ncbi:MAG: DNA repair protein RecN [Clostridia bacterium]|nr:DNA repair protein RecN [Clostridia bacterium]